MANKHRDFKTAMVSLTKCFAGDKDVMVDFDSSGMKDRTDAGKAVVLRDPDVLVEHLGMSVESAETCTKASMAHESAHIKYGTTIEEFKRAAVKIITAGAERKLGVDCLNYAEDMRVDACMGKERPGYIEQRIESTKEFIELGYKPTGSPEQNMMLAAMAGTYDIKLLWDFSPAQLKAINAAVEIFNKATEAKDQHEAYLYGWQAYVALYGEPKASDASIPEEGEEPKIDLHSRKETFDDEELDEEVEACGTGGKEEEDPEEGPEDLPDADGDGIGDADGDGEDSGGAGSVDGDAESLKASDREVRLHDPMAAERDAEDDPEMRKARDVLDGGPEPTGEAKSELEGWLDSKSSEVMHGDMIADGLSHRDVETKLRRDETAERGSERLARAQASEIDRDNIEHTSLSTEIEDKYSKGVNAGVQIWYTKEKSITMSASYRKNLLYDPRIPAAVATLTQVFKDTLRKARERDSYLHTSGSIRASRAWRGARMGDDRIFVRHSEQAAGGYAVKLLLDASGSMTYNIDMAAIVAYILAKALLDAGLAVSVEAFDAISSSCAVVHHVLLPWDSRKVERVAAYKDLEQNRDGYSIKAAAYDLSKRQENHKLLIALSDGAPFHGGSSSAIVMAGGIPGGSGPELIQDAADAVREARSNGIKVLGVYFGSSERTRKIEAEIYGQDFIPVEEVDQFANAARTYLTRVILGG